MTEVFVEQPLASPGSTDLRVHESVSEFVSQLMSRWQISRPASNFCQAGWRKQYVFYFFLSIRQINNYNIWINKADKSCSKINFPDIKIRQKTKSLLDKLYGWQSLWLRGPIFKYDLYPNFLVKRNLKIVKICSTNRIDSKFYQLSPLCHLWNINWTPTIEVIKEKKKKNYWNASLIDLKKTSWSNGAFLTVLSQYFHKKKGFVQFVCDCLHS